MATTFVAFTPTSIAPFTFQPTINGVQYNVSVPYNEFGQRYYVNVTDLSGNPIIFTALVSGGPSLLASLSWASGVATATTTINHNVPLGWPVNMRLSQSNSGFDGTYQALSTSPVTLTYPLPVNPNKSMPVTGTVNFDINLLSGLGIGSLWYQDSTGQFEF
jgi:hypothetical protein